MTRVSTSHADRDELIAELQAEIKRLAREATTRSSSRTTTSAPRCRTSPISSATRSACRARRRRPSADVIVFCGVHFMAETAAILSPAQDRAAPRPRRRLLARLDHRRRRSSAQWKAEHPGAVVVVVRQHDGRGEGGERLLLHVGQRRRGRELDPRRPGDPLPARHVPRRARAPHDGARRTSTSGWASVTCTRASIPRTFACSAAASRGGVPHPSRVRLLDERARGDVGGRHRSRGRADPLDRGDDQAARALERRRVHRRDGGRNPASACGARIRASDSSRRTSARRAPT